MSSLWDSEPRQPLRAVPTPDESRGRTVLAVRRFGQLPEVIARLGVSRNWAFHLRKRPDFPRPVAEWQTGPVWDLDEVESWWLRRRSGNYRGRQDWLRD